MRPRLLQRSEAFLSTPSARRATGRSVKKHPKFSISIHALREEGDQIERTVRKLKRISIHALREEGDTRSYGVKEEHEVFLSTPSARRATAQEERHVS